MRKRLLLVMLILGGTAQAAEWVSIGKTDDGKAETLIDVSDIRVSGDIRRAWIQASRADSSRTMYREAFNCADETSRSEAIDIYSPDGSVERVPDKMLSDEAWRPARPGTTWHVAMDFVCAWKH